MKPEWFNYQDIPFDQMWSDDKYWFPHFLENTRFMGYFHLAQDQKTILIQKFNKSIAEDDLLQQFDFKKVM
jgi:hypothetical protein